MVLIFDRGWLIVDWGRVLHVTRSSLQIDVWHLGIQVRIRPPQFSVDPGFGTG